MAKKNAVARIGDFLGEVAVELKKSSWPTRAELIDSTWIIMVSTVAMGVFVASADIVFAQIIKFLTGAS